MKLVVPDIQWVNGHYLGFQSVYLNSPCVAPCFHRIQVFLTFFAEGGLCFCRHKNLRIVRIFEFSPISILQHFCDENMKSNGESTLSCGTPCFGLLGELNTPSSFVRISRHLRKFRRRSKSDPRIPAVHSFSSRHCATRYRKLSVSSDLLELHVICSS